MLKLCESFGVKMHLLQIIKSISIILHEEFRNAQIESSKLPDILDVNDLQCAMRIHRDFQEVILQ